MLEVATSALPTGVFQQAMNWIAIAHSKAYDYIHKQRCLLFAEALECLITLHVNLKFVNLELSHNLWSMEFLRYDLLYELLNNV